MARGESLVASEDAVVMHVEGRFERRVQVRPVPSLTVKPSTTSFSCSCWHLFSLPRHTTLKHHLVTLRLSPIPYSSHTCPLPPLSQTSST